MAGRRLVFYAESRQRVLWFFSSLPGVAQTGCANDVMLLCYVCSLCRLIEAGFTSELTEHG